MYPLDLRELHGPFPSAERNFEELCSMLVKAAHPRARVVSVHPPDAGIDFLGVRGTRSIAYQCKYFTGAYGQVQERQIVDSLRRAKANRRRVPWNRYVLCLPRNLTEPQRHALDRVASVEHVSVELVDLSKLLEWLVRFPHVKSFFFPVQSEVLANALSALLLHTERSRSRKYSLTRGLFFSRLLPPGRGVSRMLQAAADLVTLEGDWASAVSLLTDALQCSTIPTERWDIQRALAVLYGQQGNRVVALRLFREVANSAPAEVAAFSLVDEAELVCDQGFYKRADGLVRKALKLGGNFFSREQRAHCATVSGDIAFGRGDFRAAESEYRRALGEAGDSTWMRGAIAARLADVHRRQGRLREALESYRQAQDLLEPDGDLRLLGEVLTGQGMLMLQMGQFELAEHYHLRALRFEERLGHERGRAVCWNNLALVALERRDCDLAEEYAQKALEQSRKIRDRHGTSYPWAILGKVAIVRGDLPEAARAFQSALKVASQVGSRLGVALAKLGQAEVAQGQKALSKARERCAAALRSLRSLGAHVEIAAAERLLATILDQLGRKREAKKMCRAAATRYKRLGLLRQHEATVNLLRGFKNATRSKSTPIR